MVNEPTRSEVEAAKRVRDAVLHEMNLIGLEGASVRAVLAGASTAISDVIAAKAGPDRIVPWFEGEADRYRQLQRGEG